MRSGGRTTRGNAAFSRWRSLTATALTALLALGAFGACGDAIPPRYNDDPFPSPSPNAPTGGGGGGDSFLSDAASAAPPCGIGPDGGQCACADIPILSDVPNLYFILDRSGSMNDGDKWNTIRNVVADVVTKLGPRANFGAAFFPSTDSQCSPGVEVMPVRPGDAPAGTAGPTAKKLLAATAFGAAGGTPTAATLNALAPRLKGLSGRTFAILATDGGPNCDPQASCGADTCIPNIESALAQCLPSGPSCCTATTFGTQNCLDADATVAAAKALGDAGIPVYVVGVPGSAPYENLLDEVATAGGTARPSSPFYYRVDSTDTAAFGAALSQIAAKIVASCNLSLGTPPADPNLVNVYFDGTVVPKSSPDGWTIDGANITLVGQSCSRVLSGSVLDVRIVAGCPTVIK